MRPYIRNTIIALCCTEIAFQLFKRFKRKLNSNIMNSDFNEVLFTNNLSIRCLKIHESTNDCNNIYCYIKNYERIIELINSAQYSITLSMYIFTSVELANAIIKAKKNGIRVRIIADRTMSFSSGSQIQNFIKNDVPVRFNAASKYIMHHKFCLIDVEWNKEICESEQIENDKNMSVKNSEIKKVETCVECKNGLLITGSLNWTMQAFTSNWDNIVITSNKELIQAFQNEFQRMWCDFQPPD